MQAGEDLGWDYASDGSGNLRSESTSRLFDWNHSDALTVFQIRAEGAEPSVHAHYLYDASGQRVKRLVRKPGGHVEVTHYIDGVFEHHRWSGPAHAGENDSVHLMDDRQRIAIVRLGRAHPDDRGPQVEFQLGDHLGSCTVAVDAGGTVAHREDYSPYGETTFRTFARKRYRFTGKERDGESGLSYHVARYYAPWLGRWTSADPIGCEGGMNLYAYCDASPLTRTDANGTSPQDGPSNGFWSRVWKGIVAKGRAILAVGGLSTNEADDIAPKVQETQEEVGNKSKPGSQGSPPKPPPEPPPARPAEAPDKRLVTARDLHGDRNLGKAPTAEPQPPDKRLATAADLHANRNAGNAPAATVASSGTGTTTFHRGGSSSCWSVRGTSRNTPRTRSATTSTS
jgi:RHS repeat-associated protein